MVWKGRKGQVLGGTEKTSYANQAVEFPKRRIHENSPKYGKGKGVGEEQETIRGKRGHPKL